MRGVGGAVVGLVLLVMVAGVALFVAAAGSTTTVGLQWQRIGADVRLSALGLFLLGGVAVLVAEVGVRWLLGARAALRARTGTGRRSTG